jgi:GT2 family glycosyltransferase
MSDNPFISVIIVTLNKRDLLQLTLNSLFNSTYDKWELIIVDNGSTDGTIDYIRKLMVQYPDKIHLIPLKHNVGHAMGVNIGIIRSKYEYILKLDDDVIIDPSCINILIENIITDKQISAVQCNIIEYYGKISTKIMNLISKLKKDHSRVTLTDYLGFSFNTKYVKEITEIFYPHTTAVLFRKSYLYEVGLFDPILFFYLDEVDVGWRLHLRASKILINPRAHVIHIRKRYSFSRMIKESFFNYFKNHLIILWKNYELFNAFKAISVSFLILLGFAFITSIYKRKADIIIIFLKSLFFFLRNLKLINRNRFFVNKYVRKVSDSYVKKFMIKPYYNYNSIKMKLKELSKRKPTVGLE